MLILRGGVNCLDLVLENYVDLSTTECAEVLKWRNNREIAKNFYNQNEISLQEHLDFIASLRQNPKKQYFLLRFCGIGLGCIYFTFKNEEEVEFGFFGNPDLKVSGIGRVLEQSSLFYVFNVLKARKLCLEVFVGNKQVINLHKKFGFQICGEKEVKGQRVLEMVKRNP